MKKIRLLFLTLVALLGITSAAAKTVYLKPNSNWLQDNARFALYMYGGGEAAWTDFAVVDSENKIYKATFDDSQTNMIFVRLNPSTAENSFNDGVKWNQTADLAAPTFDNELFTLGDGWDNPSMTTAYYIDFNTSIVTSNHDFKVAKGWNHIVSTNDYDGNGPYYMNYYYYGSMGVGSTGCLCATRQYAGDYGGGGVVNDILVTPAVNGTVKLDIKAYGTVTNSNPAFVEVYAINNDGTLGELQKTIKEDIAGYNSGNNTEWATFELADLASEQKLGLRCQYVYIDNFTATSVNIPAARTLEVTKVANLEGYDGTGGTTTYFEQQSDGNLKVQLQVTLTNTGDYGFAPGDDGYTLTLASASYASGDKTYYDAANVNIPEALAAGETKAIDVDFYIPYTTGWKYYFVRENISGTTSSTSRYAGETAYESKFVLREAGSSSTTDLTTAQAYGRVSTATTRSFEIYNDGTAPLTIKSITLPAGFTSDNLPEIPVEGLVVAKKSATDAFNVTLPVDVLGDFSGNLTITYLKAGDAEPTVKNLAFSGTVLAEGTWFADFNGVGTSNDGVYPAGSVVTSSTGLQFGYTGSYGSYDHYLKPYSSAGTLVMPKLTATAGAQLKYDAVRYQSGNSYYLKVYVSTDRKTWGEAKATINNSDLGATGSYTQTLTFDEAGDYYVAFELYGVGLDNVIGLTKTAVAHDVFFKETNLVAEAQTGKAIKPSVKAIPLTDEAAANYEVKYYVDGVAVATATSINLETSATLDKTFNINYTPEDAVTTEHDTYIAFEFEGGTVIATDHQTLRVTNEPKFLFVAAATSVSQYTTNLTTAQAFGKTNTADVKSFKIYNQGTAPLTIKSIAAPAGFSVNKATEFVVAAGENEDVEVTFSTETPGEYSGNLVVTYEQEGEQTFELAFSGTKLDPTKWYANFDNPSSNSIIWPAGLVYESNIQTSSSGYGPYNCFVYTSANNTENNKLITPLLNANAGDKFCFDVKKYSTWGTPNVAVYLSTDRKTWGEAIHNVESVTNTDFETVEVTIPAAGNYYVGIAMVGVYVDELYGLKLAEVEHDWQIASSNIPAEGMQNVTKNASVNVLNLGIADEAADSYEVNLYIDGEKTATATTTPALAMAHQLSAAGTQIAVPMQSPKVGTFPVYIEVKAGDYNVKTEPVDVTFAAEVAAAEAGLNGASTSSYGPVYMGDKNCETVSLYTAEILAASGLKAGDKITSIYFKGYNTNQETTSKFEVWYEWTDEQTLSKPTGELCTESYVSTMTKIADDASRSWPIAGSNTEWVKLIEFDFSGSPLTYQSGKSLRIVVRNQAENYRGKNFEVTSYNNLYYRHSSDYSSYISATWNSNYLPAIHFDLAPQTATLSGTVTDGTNAVEGATVTLVSTDGDNIQYTGTTDAEGAYSINVIQAAREYNVTVTKEGLPDATATVAFGGESKTKNFYMVEPLVVTFVNGAGWENVNAYTYNSEQSGSWPGTGISKTGTTTIQGVEYDVYTYSLQVPESSAPEKIIFNNGGSGDGNQTADLDFANSQQYVYGVTYYSVAGAFQADGTDYDVPGVFGTAWATELNDMTMNAEGLYELSFKDISLPNGTHKFKVLENHAWTPSYPASNYEVYVANAGTYDLTITFDATGKNVSHKLTLTLADSQAKALDLWPNNTPADVTVARTLKAGWNAMVLPFDVTAEEIAAQFGANAQVAEFTGDEKNDDKVSVNFAKSDVITANKPFLINLESVPGTVKFLNKSVTFAEAKSEGTNFDFVGIYADGSAAAGDYIMAGGMLKCASGSNAIKAYRSYLKTKGAAPARISIFVDGELIGEAEGTGEATGIQGIDVKQAEGLYNMGGQKVTGRTKKGVYILNGKKVFVGDRH